MDRRPLKVRGAKWAHDCASLLARCGVTPNHISIMSVIFAFLALIAFANSHNVGSFLILAPIFIQLRLICNLMDGLVAVEHKKSTPNGELFNDVPDRFADVFIIVGAALAIPNSEVFPIRPLDLGWISACLAVITAYSRVLGKSLGTPSYFFGPMAKQHRMFFITVTSIVEFFLHGSSSAGYGFYGILALIAIGSLITTFRRLGRISQNLLGERND